MAVVVFNPEAFAEMFPEFSGLSATTTTTCFNLATLYCNNSDSSVVVDIPTRTTFLYFLTAHVAKLYYGTNDGQGNIVPPTEAVGRVDVAKEGSVHTRLDMGPPSAAAAWYNQTKYGAAYWAASVKYRTMLYVPFQGNIMNNPGPTPALWPWGRW